MNQCLSYPLNHWKLAQQFQKQSLTEYSLVVNGCKIGTENVASLYLVVCKENINDLKSKQLVWFIYVKCIMLHFFLGFLFKKMIIIFVNNIVSKFLSCLVNFKTSYRCLLSKWIQEKPEKIF